jgi:hypothetical protein
MLKSRVAMLCLALSPVLTACGSSVTVEVMSEGPDGLAPVSDLEVLFLPYDRDSVFASLAAAAPDPEPQMPADLEAQRDSVQVLQEAWRELETRWNAVRDSLRQLSDRLSGMDSRSREYVQLYQQFSPMEGRERSLNRQRQQAFDAFTTLQETTSARVDSFAVVLTAWEDQAFESYPEVEADLLAAVGQGVVIDTTNAEGRITLSLGGGAWWVHTRVSAAAGELYWNVPIADADTVRLTPQNAELRQVY